MFEPTILALTAGLIFVGLVSFCCGLAYNRRPIVIEKRSPFDADRKLPPSVAFFGAVQVMEYAIERGEAEQYLRAKSAIERYETDHEIQP
jgi:hypothetical protein